MAFGSISFLTAFIKKSSGDDEQPHGICDMSLGASVTKAEYQRLTKRATTRRLS